MTDSSAARLAVIVVTYNSASVVREALGALPLEGIELIVVDNESTDSTLDLVSTEFPSARIIQTGGNLGFSRAVNVGVANSDSEYILLLNPDAVVSGATIARALHLLDADQTIGVLSPDVVEGSGNLRTMAGGFEPSIWRMFNHAAGLSRLSHRFPAFRGHYLLRSQVTGGSPINLCWVSGGCLFTRKSVWQAMSGLSERWFMYAEDVEYCLRVHESGSRVVLDPSLSAKHLVGSSSGDASQIKTVWLSNLFDLYQSHYRASRFRRLAWRTVVWLGFSARSLQASLRNRISPSAETEHDVRRFRAYARAIATTSPSQ